MLVVEFRSEERWLSHGGSCRVVAADMEIPNRLDWYMGTFGRKMWVTCGYVRCASATRSLPTFIGVCPILADPNRNTSAKNNYTFREFEKN